MNQSEYAKQEYQKSIQKFSPKSPIVSNCSKAFLSGGLICGLGQLLLDYYANFFTDDEAALLLSITLIGISAILTGFGIYEKLGHHCGAGTIVPITGFSNSVAAPAIEFKKEGLIFGTGAKMFLLAGPVIVYGLISSIIVGSIYYIIQTFV